MARAKIVKGTTKGRPTVQNMKVSNESLKRLSLKAGASKLGVDAASLMRSQFYGYMDELMKTIVVHTELKNLRTIKPDAVLAAIKVCTGDNVYV